LLPTFILNGTIADLDVSCSLSNWLIILPVYILPLNLYHVTCDVTSDSEYSRARRHFISRSFYSFALKSQSLRESQFVPRLHTASQSAYILVSALSHSAYKLSSCCLHTASHSERVMVSTLFHSAYKL
jgi:hypothetical protein